MPEWVLAETGPATGTKLTAEQELQRTHVQALVSLSQWTRTVCSPQRGQIGLAMAVLLGSRR